MFYLGDDIERLAEAFKKCDECIRSVVGESMFVVGWEDLNELEKLYSKVIDIMRALIAVICGSVNNE